ncbi:MAG: hypothetical protein PHR16_05085 [Methylovulum sp.]|nr:hypothetical protein [Methylovulum sp.]
MSRLSLGLSQRLKEFDQFVSVESIVDGSFANFHLDPVAIIDDFPRLLSGT